MCSCTGEGAALTLLTESPNVAGQAQAGEGVEAVDARGSVPARVGLALIDICSRKQNWFHHPPSLQQGNALQPQSGWWLGPVQSRGMKYCKRSQR